MGTPDEIPGSQELKLIYPSCDLKMFPKLCVSTEPIEVMRNSTNRTPEPQRGSNGGQNDMLSAVIHSGTLEVYTEPRNSILSTTKKVPYWRAHRFLLENKKLYMMNESKVARAMELNHLVSAKAATLNELGRTYCFIIALGFVGPGNKLIVNAENDKDRDEWIELINIACSSKTTKALKDHFDTLRRKSASSISRPSADVSVSPVGKGSIPTTSSGALTTTPQAKKQVLGEAKSSNENKTGTNTKATKSMNSNKTVTEKPLEKTVTTLMSEEPYKGLSVLRVNIFVSLALLAGTVLTKMLVNVEPYMDEVFHIPQAQSYCDAKFYPDGWNSKITTFPGVYMLTFALKTSWEFFVWLWREGKSLVTEKEPPVSYWLYDDSPTPSVDLGINMCSVMALRAQSVVLGCLIFFAAAEARRAIVTTRANVPGEGPTASALLALIVTLFPVSTFFYFLFYTDTASTLLLVLSMWAINSTPSGSLAKLCNLALTVTAGTAAIAMRQTNVVWIAFMAGTSLIPRQSKDGEQSGLMGPVVAFLKNLIFLNGPCYGHLKAALLLSPVGAFIYFVFYMNEGSIVLGDRSSHTPVLHWAMPMHALAILSLLLSIVGPPRESLMKVVPVSFSATHAVGHTLGMIGVTASLYYSSLDHPYLIADNRHYTFYIWKRILSDEKVRLALGPIYYYFIQRGVLDLVQANGVVWVTGFLLAVALTLVPTPLLEPRYFIPTVVIGLLASRHTLVTTPLPTSYFLRLITVIIAFLVMNAVTLYVFTHLPFQGAGGEIARFMY